MEILSVIPRGYCQGVVRAIQIARRTVQDNPGTPIHMLGMIVHNRYVVEECENLGIISLEQAGRTRLELLDEIDSGIVIFTAHGVSDAVYEKARAKGLKIVDATCMDVSKTHELVRNHVPYGDVLYIGKKGHPEAEGVLGLSPRVHLYSCKEDLHHLNHLENVLITNQTTLSILQTRDLIDEALHIYPDAKVAKEICNATTIRQEAVSRLQNVDVLFVVGDPHSNNSRQLRQIGLESGIQDAYLIEDVTQITLDMIQNKERVAVTSGSSTPNSLTEQVITFLKNYAETGQFTRPISSKVNVL